MSLLQLLSEKYVNLYMLRCSPKPSKATVKYKMFPVKHKIQSLNAFNSKASITKLLTHVHTIPAAMSRAICTRSDHGNGSERRLIFCRSVPPPAYSVINVNSLPGWNNMPMKRNTLGWSSAFNSVTYKISTPKN